MPQDQVKVKPEEVKSVPTTPVTEQVKKKGISPWIIVLIVALILIPCILCFVFMILPLVLTTATITTQLSTTSTAQPILDDY
jgi:predicted PurR-regulated permease PerM